MAVGIDGRVASGMIIIAGILISLALVADARGHDTVAHDTQFAKMGSGDGSDSDTTPVNTTGNTTSGSSTNSSSSSSGSSGDLVSHSPTRDPSNSPPTPPPTPTPGGTNGPTTKPRPEPNTSDDAKRHVVTLLLGIAAALGVVSAMLFVVVGRRRRTLVAMRAGADGSSPSSGNSDEGGASRDPLLLPRKQGGGGNHHQQRTVRSRDGFDVLVYTAEDLSSAFPSSSSVAAPRSSPSTSGPETRQHNPYAPEGVFPRCNVQVQFPGRSSLRRRDEVRALLQSRIGASIVWEKSYSDESGVDVFSCTLPNLPRLMEWSSRLRFESKKDAERIVLSEGTAPRLGIRFVDGRTLPIPQSSQSAELSNITRSLLCAALPMLGSAEAPSELAAVSMRIDPKPMPTHWMPQLAPTYRGTAPLPLRLTGLPEDGCGRADPALARALVLTLLRMSGLPYTATFNARGDFDLVPKMRGAAACSDARLAPLRQFEDPSSTLLGETALRLHALARQTWVEMKEDEGPVLFAVWAQAVHFYPMPLSAPGTNTSDCGPSSASDGTSSEDGATRNTHGLSPVRSSAQSGYQSCISVPVSQ